MHLHLFDNRSDALEIWRRVSLRNGCGLEASSEWPGIERVPLCARILVVDQTVNPSQFVENVIQLSVKRPNQVVVLTGAQLEVPHVVKAMQGCVNFVFRMPQDRDRIEASFSEIIVAAQEKMQKQQEYQALEQLFRELTHREKSVLDYVLRGCSNKETAAQLNVSVRTIEARRAKVYSKTRSSCIAELVRKVDRFDFLRRVFEVPASGSVQCSKPSETHWDRANSIARTAVHDLEQR